MFLFYIDNQLTDQPVNDMDLTTSIVRDKEFNAVLITQDVELIYNGNNNLQTGQISGYTYLKNMFDSGSCNEAAVEVYDFSEGAISPTLLYKGIIKVPEISIDQQEANLKSKVRDNSYYSYIRNNRTLKVNFAANATKSREDITPLQFYTVDLFDSQTCNYGGVFGFYFKGYRLTDTFEFIIACISDNQLGFRSNYLSSLTEEIFIFKGQSLVTSFTFFPAAPEPVHEISFEELFAEINKIYNLVFYIDYSDVNNPVFCIEDYESTFGAATVLEFDDIKIMKTSIDSNGLYSDVEVGSEVVVDGQDPAYTWNAATSNWGWKKEQFFPLGQCNTSTQLNLINRFIIDNNAIQDSLVLQGTAEINSYFLILCSNIDSVGLTAEGHQFTYFGSPDCFYNLGINNFFKLQRHSSKFETTFGNFLGIGTDGFRALLGDSSAQDVIYTTVPATGLVYVPPGGITSAQIPYVNETTNGGYDGGNNYNNTTYRYVVPVTGDYSFLSRFFVQVSGMQGTSSGFLDTFLVTNTIRVFDSANNLKFSSSQVFTLAGISANGFHTLDTTLSGLIDATDYVNVSIRVQYQPNQSGNQNVPRFLSLINSTFFECNGTPDGGISITSGNNSVKRYLHEFEYSISASDWELVKAGAINSFRFIKDGVIRTGWIDSMKHNDWTGQTQIKLITQDATTTN